MSNLSQVDYERIGKLIDRSEALEKVFRREIDGRYGLSRPVRLQIEGFIHDLHARVTSLETVLNAVHDDSYIE